MFSVTFISRPTYRTLALGGPVDNKNWFTIVGPPNLVESIWGAMRSDVTWAGIWLYMQHNTSPRSFSLGLKTESTHFTWLTEAFSKPVVAYDSVFVSSQQCRQQLSSPLAHQRKPKWACGKQFLSLGLGFSAVLTSLVITRLFLLYWFSSQSLCS